MKEEVTLFRGSSVLYRKAEESSGIVHFVFSTDDVDSYGDVIEQEGWVLDRYMKNPVILWAHDHRTPAIGYTKDIGKSPVLNGDIMFNPKEIDPFGGKIKDLIDFGSIKAGSVGFNPVEWEVLEHKEGSYTIIDGYRFKKQELMEFSVCNVPANPFALVDYKEDDKKKAVKPLSGFQYFFPGKE
jgi:phage head maturation protease